MRFRLVLGMLALAALLGAAALWLRAHEKRSGAAGHASRDGAGGEMGLVEYLLMFADDEAEGAAEDEERAALAAAAETGAVVAGRVTTAGDGLPVRGAEVLVETCDGNEGIASYPDGASPDFRAETDGGGQYRISGIMARCLVLRVSAEEGVAPDRKLSVVPFEIRTGVDFDLARTGALAGRIADEDTDEVEADRVPDESAGDGSGGVRSRANATQP